MADILAIDPGTVFSGWVRMVNGAVLFSRQDEPNIDVLSKLRQMRDSPLPILACEMVAHYGSGMPAGREVFETVEWIGRFREAWESRGGLFIRVYRSEVKQHLCRSARAKDANVRQALIDRYGGEKVAKGSKAAPGPLYGVAGHAWQALAVGITAQDLKLNGGADGRG